MFHRSIINLSGLLIHRLLAHQDIIFYTFNPAFTAPDLHHIDRSFSLPSSVFHIWRISLGTSKRPVVDFGVQILRTFSFSLLGISLGCITTGMAISCSSPFPAAGAGGSAGGRAWAEQKTCGLNPKIVHGLSVLVNLVIHEGKPDYFFRHAASGSGASGLIGSAAKGPQPIHSYRGVGIT